MADLADIAADTIEVCTADADAPCPHYQTEAIPGGSRCLSCGAIRSHTQFWSSGVPSRRPV